MDWETHEIPFVPVTSLAFSNLIGDEVYVIDRGTNFYKYNFKNKVWTALASPAADANRICGLIWKPTHGVAGRVYVPGTTTIGTYDIASNTWSSSAAAGVLALRAICFSDDDTIWAWAAGGGPKDQVYRYTISTGSWTAYSGDTAYNVSWSCIYYGNEVYAFTNAGIRKFNPATDSYSSVDAATGLSGIIGHVSDKLCFYDASVDYGSWNPSDKVLRPDLVEADTITAGYERYAVMDPESRSVVAMKNATELSVYVGRTYRFVLAGLNIPYEDTDKTKKLHVILKNLSPTAKQAGAGGEVVIEVSYELAS